MKLQHAPTRGLRAPPRLAAALAAITIVASVASALLLAFHSASPAVWLSATPQVMEMVAECDQGPDRKARDRCKQRWVTALLARDPQAQRLARR